MINVQKVFLAIVSAVLVCSVLVPASTSQNFRCIDGSEDIVLEFGFSMPTIEQVDALDGCFDRVVMGDLPNSCDVDQVRLPVKPLKVLVPYGRMVDSVEVVVDSGSSLGVGYDVEKGHTVIPFTSGELSDVMSDGGFGFVDGLFSVVGTYMCRGYVILCVNLHPVQYSEDTGELIWFEHMQLKVDTIEATSIRGVRGISEDFEMVMRQVVNPSVMETYEQASQVVPREVVDYVVITSEELRDATGEYTFQDLIISKQEKGMSAAIVTVEDIVATSDYWVNGLWGDNNPSNPFYYGAIQGSIALFNDTQAQIRNFIRYAYTMLGTQYVLLGGDADYTPSDNIVPCRELFAVEDGLPLGSRDLVEEDIPSDVYYACLDGNFNRDEDGHWGENATQNGYNDEDEADLFSEVYVGRACVDADDEVSNFVMKTLGYEASDDPYIFTGLMVGEYLGFPGVSAYGGNYKDLIIPLFPDSFVVDTLYDREASWSKYDLMNMLNTDTPHLINHLGHGNVQYGLKMGISDIGSLTNDKYFFVYSQTCLAGSFDNSNNDCAAEYFTVETPHGAFAVIMNARYGLGSEDTLVSPSQVVDESFFTALFTENLRALGQANHFAKEDHVWHINENGIRWVYYETNLFGDPEVRIHPYSTPPEVPDQPVGPTEGVIGVEYMFESCSTDVEGDMIYYMFDWGDNTSTSWMGPYASGLAVQASHFWSVPGDYEIRVKARDDNSSANSEWSDPLEIIIHGGPIMDIRTIAGGMLHVGTEIFNTGGIMASDVNWSITLDGGVILLGETTTGKVSEILPGESAAIQSGVILGFGKISVIVTADIDDGLSDMRSQGGFVFLFFAYVNPGGG